MNLTCYKCGGYVAIKPRRQGHAKHPLYRAACYGKGTNATHGCGMFQDYLGEGTQETADAHYHRIAVAHGMTRDVEPEERKHG
jgi:hypothetical protein